MNCLRLILVSAVIASPAGVTLGVRAQQTQQPSDRPATSATINANYPCVVTGAVRTPTRLELHRRVRLSEALAAAGGLTDYAGRTVQIVHRAGDSGCRELSLKSDSQTLNLDDVPRGSENSDPELQRGDVVLVSEADRVYVVGNVVKPQALILKATMTLTQALTLAGGVLPDTRTERIRLIRQVPGSTARTEITVDLKAIRKHKADDLVLEPNDIIDVPSKHNHPGHGDVFGVSSEQLPVRVIN